MANYSDQTVEQLKEEAKSRNLSGYSALNKDDLVALLEKSDEGDSSEEETTTLGHDSEASDADNPEVVSNLSPEGQEALGEMGDEQAEQADLALDASGPLHLQKPSERLMAGATSEEEAKEQEKLIGDLPEDFVGNILGDGSLAEAKERKGSGPNGEIVQEDVINFPPPIGVAEKNVEEDAEGRKATHVNAPYTEQDAAKAAFPDEGPTVAKDRLYNQRGQLYTDGLSGEADHNQVRAYRVSDVTGSDTHEAAKAEAKKAEAAEAPEDSKTEDTTVED